MDWWSLFLTINLIGIGSNLDNWGVGMAYGGNKVKFPYWVDAVVNLVGFFTALIGACAGAIISRYLPVTAAQWVACIALSAIGVYFWYTAYNRRRTSTHKQPTDKQPTKVEELGLKQAIFLGLALSFTNVASGFGATVAHAGEVWLSVFSITVWGFIMIWLGNVIGIGVVSRFLGRYASLAAGLLLIVAGLHQVYR
ncbi:manganese efflux pump MntP family protein [Alicyclobacillus herbarius]|uniref:manganese efflux pump MntP n=1 Tax=Alicyclobacillus herbarius TaxID=122960 RepID=UPI0003FA347B|nr:manganese efflux pump [Alicyclobacillus herbarius]